MKQTLIQPATHVLFTESLDLASETLGGKAIAANDDFFAPKENLLKASSPVFIADKYTENGKWMDGWESRRKRVPGHDWCVVQLGLPGVIRGVNVDTSHFTGNFPEFCSIEACETEGDPRNSAWTEILGKSKLRGDSHNLLAVSSPKRWTHLRLNIFPDGGVARLRVHGEVKPDWNRIAKIDGLVDLACVASGGQVVTCNDMFFGQKDNLILPDRAPHMGEGWETRRRRGPGFDWIIIQLGAPGKIRRVEVDTNHFKGNFPDSCSIEGCSISGKTPQASDFRDNSSIVWREILPHMKLQAHHRHLYDGELKLTSESFTHVRLNIFPDGGVSRLRIFGVPVEPKGSLQDATKGSI